LSVPEGEALQRLDLVELGGEGFVLAQVEKLRLEGSDFLGSLYRAFLDFFDGEGVKSSIRFRFKGEMLGSTEDDFPGVDSRFLNRENDLGVALETNGRMLMSGVMDSSLDDTVESRLLRRRRE
tara:strand:+ start:1361 stop:1729 length:369 start_codon:yes stop_codon:yes gene_type:complete